MIELPEKIGFRTVMFLDGAKGYAAQGRVNDEYGIHITSERTTRHEAFRHVVTMDGVEGSFESLQGLRDAVALANSDAEQADYVKQLESVNAPDAEVKDAKTGAGYADEGPD